MQIRLQLLQVGSAWMRPDILAMSAQKDKLWSRWVDVAFSKLDSNGDGYIDLDELIVRLPMLTGTDNPEAERVLAVSRWLL